MEILGILSIPNKEENLYFCSFDDSQIDIINLYLAKYNQFVSEKNIKAVVYNGKNFDIDSIEGIICSDKNINNDDLDFSSIIQKYIL